jgi:F-type H+-transporting ATPase subunit gamma
VFAANVSDSLDGLRRKLGGATQLGAVVRAMKAIAASSIVQYERAVEALGQYEQCVDLGLRVCLDDRLPVRPTAGHAGNAEVGALVFGTDQGLVGRFNEVIGNFTVTTLKTLPGRRTLWVVGDRVTPSLEAAGLRIAKRFRAPSSVAAITALVTEIQVEMAGFTAGGGHREVHVFHCAPRPAGRYEATGQRLLPLDATWLARLKALPWPKRQLPEVVGDRATTLASLVHEQLFITLYRACAESLASENASRLEAMQRAEENIDSVTNELQQSINRLRQSSIDEELFDVVAGFNALI